MSLSLLSLDHFIESMREFFTASVRKDVTVIFLSSNGTVDHEGLFVDFTSYYRAVGFPPGAVRTRLRKALFKNAQLFTEDIPLDKQEDLENVSSMLGYDTTKKLFTKAKFFVRVSDIPGAIRSCFVRKTTCEEKITEHDKIADLAEPAFKKYRSMVKMTSKKTSVPQDHLHVNLSFFTNVPNGFLPDFIPPLLGLQFSLYEVPIEPQTKSSIYYVNRWDAYNKEPRDSWTYRDLHSTLYKSSHALWLSKWRSFFYDTKSNKRKKSIFEDNVAHILAIRSDDLARSGVCVKIEEAIESVTFRLLKSRSTNAINFLFPTMVKDDVVYLKTYFSDKKDLLEERVRGFLPKSTLLVDKDNFDEDLCPSKSEAMEMMKHVPYIDHLHRLDAKDLRTVSMAMFTQVTKAKKKRKLKDALKRGTSAGILEEEEEEEEGEDGEMIDRVRVYGDKYAKECEGDILYMQEGLRAVKPYRRCNRNIPPFGVRCNTMAFFDPYVAVDALPIHFSKEDPKDGKYVVELPKETYRLIPIWLFPIVLDVCQGEMLIDMIADEYTIASRVQETIKEALDEKLADLEKIHSTSRPTNPFSVSPKDHVSAQEAVVKGCQTLLRHSTLLYETLHKRNADDMWKTIIDLSRRVDLNEQRLQFLYEKTCDMNSRLGIVEEEEEEGPMSMMENSLSSLGME